MPSSVDLFLKVISQERIGGGETGQWPLNPPQINPYFEAEQALDIYDVLQKIKNRKTKKELARLFGWPGVLRNFLSNSAIIGLKTAAAHGLRDIPVEDRISHLELLIGLLAELVQSDPLCLDYKNLILSPQEVTEELEKPWLKVTSQNRTTLAGSYLAGWTWVRALYYKAFVGLGLEVHGPYEVSKKFGEGTQLIIRDFHDIQNIPAWEISRKAPFKRIRISQIYQRVAFKITFLNHLLPAANLGSHLTHYRLEADDQAITKIGEIETIKKELTQLANQQIAAVDSLKPIEQVEKAAETSAHSLRRIYKAGGEEVRGQEYVRKNFRTFGESFLKELSSAKHQHPKYIKNIYDPRNNLLGKDLLEI